ncbi:MAG TPA: choice-of-anchor D domain-containing protein, partial [Kofleriaceae bacterium]|nr:choice-of-anchor D domain-containing protein [Kofleriaceae bacterium]
GTKDAFLNVSATPGGTVKSEMVGEGVISADLVFQGGSAAAFADTVVDYQSAETTFTVINNGDLDTGVVSVALTGANTADFEITADTCNGNALEAGGATCLITVRFAPQTAGAKTASVSLTADPGSEISAALSGQAIDKLLIVGATDDDDGSFDDPVKVGLNASQVFGLVNNGEVRDLTISITGDAGFTVDPPDCADVADGGFCVIDVTFTADETIGVHNATLTVTGDGAGIDATATLALSANVEGALVITDPALPFNFGDHVIDTDTARVFTIENQGGVDSGPITITLDETTDFAITDTCGQGIAADGSCTVEVTFSPQSEGDFAGSFTVSASVGTAIANFVGHGQTPASVVIAGEDFGGVVIGGSAQRTFTVTNPGDVDATAFTTTFTPDGTGAFSIDNDECIALTVLGPGASCAITFTFAPSTALSPDDITATLEASTDAGADDSAELHGEALSQLTINPTEVTFADTVEDTESEATVFTVTNVGFGVVTGISAEISSGDVDAFPVTTTCGSLNPGETCTATVTFTPDSSGAFDGVLTAEANQSATASANVSGTGLVEATLETDSDLAYGGVVAGSQGGTQTATFTNTGDVPTQPLLAASTSRVDFQVVADNCVGLALAAGESCTVDVRFAPEENSRGDFSEEVIVEDGDTGAAAGLFGIALTPSANLVFTPSFVVFPDTAVDETSAPVTVTLTNNSNVDLNPEIDGGGDLDAFIPAGLEDCDSLAAGASCTFQVTFTPDSADDFSAIVFALSGDATVDDAVLSLGGTGTGGGAVR